MSLYSALAPLTCPMIMRKDGSSCSFKGCIQPLTHLNDSVYNMNTLPGINDKRRFLLVAPPDTLSLAELSMNIIVSHNGLKYELLRAEPMFLGTRLSHWEGTLRCLGEDVP